MTYKLEVKPLPMPEGVSDEDLPVGFYLLNAPRIGTGLDCMSGCNSYGEWQEFIRVDDGSELPTDRNEKTRFRKDGKRVLYANQFTAFFELGHDGGVFFQRCNAPEGTQLSVVAHNSAWKLCSVNGVPVAEE